MKKYHNTIIKWLKIERNAVKKKQEERKRRMKIRTPKYNEQSNKTKKYLLGNGNCKKEKHNTTRTHTREGKLVRNMTNFSNESHQTNDFLPTARGQRRRGNTGRGTGQR